MKIVKPADWQFVSFAELDVFIEDIGEGPYECVLWAYQAYFADPPALQDTLLRTTVQACGPGIAHARLADLKNWGQCVVGILACQDGAVLAVSGVQLLQSPTNTWLRQRSVLRPDDVAGHIRFPVPIVACQLSHIAAPVAEHVSIASHLDQLLDPGADATAISVVRLLNPEPCDAHTILDEVLCIGPDRTKLDRGLQAAPYMSSAPYLASMRDLYALLPAGVIMPAGTRIWSDSTHAAFWNDPLLTQYPELFKASEQIGLVIDSVRTEQDLLDDNDIARMPGMPLIAFTNVHNNHAHWLMNSVFAIYLLRDAIMAGHISVLVPHASDYIFDTLRSIGIRRQQILVARPGLYHFERGLYPSTLSIHANTYPPHAMANMFRHINGHVARHSAAKGADRIYVTRIGSGSARTMSNELELIAALRQRGFVCVPPHELSFFDEVQCFANARIVVGQLGAGLANIGFAPKGCRIVEITTQNYSLNDIWFLSYIMEHRFSRFMVHAEPDEEFSVHGFSFYLPPDPLLNLIDQLLYTM